MRRDGLFLFQALALFTGIVLGACWLTGYWHMIQDALGFDGGFALMFWLSGRIGKGIR